MKKLNEVLSRVPINAPMHFRFQSQDGSNIVFSAECEAIIIPGDDVLTKMVNACINNTCTTQLIDGKILRFADPNRIRANIDHHMMEFLSSNWMHANGKKEIRRTKLYDLNSNVKKTPEYYDQALELFLDAKKYGVNPNNPRLPPTPIAKFIAAKYQELLEKNQ